MDKTCNLEICVDICFLDLEEYIPVLTYLYSFYDKTELLFALLAGLELHLCCCFTAKVFDLSQSVFLPNLL